MGKTRDEYLKIHWTRYPAFPSAAVKRGRVGAEDMQLESLLEMQMSDSQIKARDVLQNGDLVALLNKNKVLLLAPNLSTRTDVGQWAANKDWQDFLQHVRRYFLGKSFQEVKTPTLVACPGTEPSLDVFETYQMVKNFLIACQDVFWVKARNEFGVESQPARFVFTIKAPL